MRGSLRNWDSKISFFAFADVITSVSGMLIFITLLLATDLERPAESSSGEASAEMEKQLDEIQRQQAEADARNARLQELLASAESAPAPTQLEADISQLRQQLLEEQQKQTHLIAQLDGRQDTILARDHVLGLDDLKATIIRTLREAAGIADEETRVHGQQAGLEQRIPRAQAQLLKAREREGQVWLIPDRKGNSKEPILVTVGGTGAVLERFNHPEQRKEWDKNKADSGFAAYLAQAESQNQYFVFYVRPSGIGLYKKLVGAARMKSFDVGSDAIEEGRQLHFSTPPPLDEPEVHPSPPPASQEPSTAGPVENSTPPAKSAPVAATAPTNPAPSAPAAPPAAPPKHKSWWQRFLEWIGLA